MGVEADEQRAVDAVLLAVVANGLGDREHVGFVEAQFERSAAMSGGAEGDALRADRRIRALTEVGGDQSRHVHQAIRRCGLAGQRVDTRAHVAVAAALLSAMLCMSSAHDFTKAPAPSICRVVASASTSIPASAKRCNTFSASPPSAGMTESIRPLAENSNRVFSGMVSMVSGAASASTYSPGRACGSLLPVLAHKSRCFSAPAAASARQRCVAMSSQCAR